MLLISIKLYIYNTIEYVLWYKKIPIYLLVLFTNWTTFLNKISFIYKFIF